MDSESVRQLIELSSLSHEERQRFRQKAVPDQAREYLQLVEELSRLNIPPPSSAKKWSGRQQLIQATEHYHKSPRPWLAAFTRWAPVMPIGAAAGIVLTAFAAVSVAADLKVPAGRVSQVLSALGLQAAPDEEPSPGVPTRPGNLSGGLPPPTLEAQIGATGLSTPTPARPTDSEPRGGGEHNEQETLAPGRGSEDPSQGVFPPNHGGDNPGQGVVPPGQGSEDPGQGDAPPGQGGEDPGQGVVPPGQGGDNPGQGDAPPGQGGEDPGQGVVPPGR